jgi:hypothetical protein
MMKRTAILFVLVLILAACASPLRVNYFPGAGRFPATRPASVDLLRWEPLRPHVAFASIRYNPPVRMSRGQVEWELRQRGASIGADALVIEVDTIYREKVWVGPYRQDRDRRGRRHVVRGRIIEAIAVRYR